MEAEEKQKLNQVLAHRTPPHTWTFCH
jgi:hypothetical protein